MKMILKRILACCLCGLMLLNTACGTSTQKSASGSGIDAESTGADTETDTKTGTKTDTETETETESGLTDEKDEDNLNYNLDKVSCTFMGETMDVIRDVMEIRGGMVEPVKMKVEFSFGPEGMIYKVRQIKGKEVREITQSTSPEFSFMADELEPGVPVYMTVTDKDNKILTTRTLALRVHKSLMAERVPDAMGSEFGSGFKIDMDDFVPGMALNVLPFLIPVTVKTYADGAVRVGIGVNSSDAEFWKKAANGEMPEDEMAATLKALYKKEYGKTDQPPKAKGLGLIFVVGGWAEGNVNSLDPIKGHVQMYVGSGVNISGQYMLFTWDVTLTAGAEGSFDFSYKFNPADSKYHFGADQIMLGVKWGVELYGGVGCKFASVGVYGAASLEYLEEMYPDPDAEHLILAGELGLKAKLFGKVLASFTIVAGSKDFLEDEDKKKSLGTALSAEDMKEFLLSADYANTAGVLVDDTGEMQWFGTDVDSPEIVNEWIDDRDFSHLLASDIYPENHIQIINAGSKAMPSMEMVFLENDTARASGNRSRLMSSYFNINTNFVSDPVPVADDGTADFDPYIYCEPGGKPWLVWKNALSPLTADMTFAEIAANTDIVCAEYQVGSSWYQPQQVTHFAGTGKYAASARVGTDKDGTPVIVVYTNDTNDPLGLKGNHEVYLYRRQDREWVSEKVTEFTGMAGAIDIADFGGVTVALSYESGGQAVTELWRGGEKVWDRKKAANPRFMPYGNGRRMVWFEDGKLFMLSPDNTRTQLTPKDITIPNSNYELYGELGGGPLMIVSTKIKDTSGNAFAFYSKDGSTWGKADLTEAGKNATITHLSAAFTYENEPVVVYTVQNYQVNADLDKLIEDPLSYKDTNEVTEPLKLGDDGRFTDIQSDLYIKARLMNRHVTLEDGQATDADTALPEWPVHISLTVTNTGLYDVDHAVILCEGEKVGELNQPLKIGESAEVEVEVMVPKNPGNNLSYTFDVTTRDDLEPESTLTVPVSPGHLELTRTEHVFFKDREAIAYRVKNCGYSLKEFRIVARDEVRGVELYRKKDYVSPGGVYISQYDAPHSLFCREGCQNVTLYVLVGDEEPDDPDISVNRVYSITPLEEIYGQNIE